MKRLIVAGAALLLLLVGTVGGSSLGLAAVPSAQAAARNIVVNQSCVSGSASIDVSWSGTSSSVRQQWVDISTADNGWLSGTFLSAGPIRSDVTSYTWSGLLGGTRHYLRINQQLANSSWDPSNTVSFTTLACGSGGTNAGPGGASEEELAYRHQAAAKLQAFIVQYKQSGSVLNNPDMTWGQLDQWVLNAAALMDNFLNTMDDLAPVPARFHGVHNSLHDAVQDYADVLRAELRTANQSQLDRWFDLASDYEDRLNEAIVDFDDVVGTNLRGIR